MIDYRIATRIEEMEQIIDLEIEIWGVSERDAFPPHFLMLPQHHGGVVMIAEDGGRIIGFCLAMPVRRDGEWCLWSNIAGVHPDYQGQKVGETLKHKQRDWARDNDYASVHWTFDPLQARNANFNLNRLGVVVRTYHRNIYGVMQDSINGGMPSDRLETVWFTDDNMLQQPSPPVVLDEVAFLVYADGARPVVKLKSGDRHMYGIMLPHTRDNTLEAWQTAVRRAFQHAFAQGYEGYGFVRDAPNPYYLLRKRR
ncbi:MAG: GNAT family N-acetyltransferase [Chloroflexota bacterium]